MNYLEIESERLKFRRLTKDDIPSWEEFFVGNNRLHYMGMDTSKSNTELSSTWIDLQLERYTTAEFGHLAVLLKNTGEFIGMSGILPREINGRKEYEVAYSLKPKFWGKGYATEMAETMKEFGMNNIETDRLISIIHIDNKESENVARKNGMEIIFPTEFRGMQVNVWGIVI